MESKLPVPIHVGGGYGGDSDWRNGTWKGPVSPNVAPTNMADPGNIARSAFGVIDHVGYAVP